MIDHNPVKPSLSLYVRIILIVYILAFLSSLFIAWQSIRLAQNRMIENAYDTAINEQFRIGYAIKKMAENNNFSEEETALYLLGTVRNSSASYAEYYGSTSSYRITTQDDGTIYSNISGENAKLFTLSPKTDGTVSYFLVPANGNTYVMVSSYVKIYQTLFRVDYLEDITHVQISIANLSRQIALILFLTEMAMLILLLFVVKKALKPLDILKTQALAIAEGDYKKRAQIIHDDEIGQLAANFNQMSDAVEKHIKTLSETARLKELLASNLAHEIKTPITAIVAYADYAVKKEMKQDSFYEILEYIRKEGQRISTLSDTILKWGGLGHKNEIVQKACRSERIVEQVLHTLRYVAGQKQQEIIVKNCTELIFADEALLISLIVNLCKNALNASPENSEIHLTFKKDKAGNVIISVEDNGIGIAEDELEKIMEPFYMVDKSRDRAKGGSGLGLSLCVAIVNAHRGKMKIVSALGKGTRVNVVIPQ